MGVKLNREKGKGSLRNFAMKVIIICKMNEWMQFVTNASLIEPPSDISALVRIPIEMFSFNFPFEILCIWIDFQCDMDSICIAFKR